MDTSGHKGWWEMREFAGRTRNGVNVVKEVYRNMVTGEVHDPGPDGWNGSPPKTLTGVAAIAGFGGSDELWESAKHFESSGVVVYQKEGRTVILYD